MIDTAGTTILGIDPGSRVTGFGIIKTIGNQHHYIASGCIRCSSAKLPQRIQQIVQGMQEIVQQYSPDEVAIEDIFMHANAGAALKLGQARGAALAAVFTIREDMQVAEYSARQVKQAVVGYGAANKLQVQHMICALLSLTESPSSDAADALAVAICHSHTRKGLAQLTGATKISRGRIR